jgi:hypothetical protein
MTKENRDYLEMAFRSIECFTDDGTLQVAELQRIVDIALRDGVVDDNERRILRSLVGKLKPAELTPEMSVAIATMRERCAL